MLFLDLHFQTKKVFPVDSLSWLAIIKWIGISKNVSNLIFMRTISLTTRSSNYKLFIS